VNKLDGANTGGFALDAVEQPDEAGDFKNRVSPRSGLIPECTDDVTIDFLLSDC